MGKDFKNINISSDLLRSVENQGFTEMTAIQEKVIIPAMEGRNILGSSSTGSGKTLAFLMPILERTSWEDMKASFMVLAPSRELALQIRDDYDTLGRYKKLKAVALYGKHPFKEEEASLKNRHHAICGTPGRVLDHIKRGTLDTSAIRFLVIDEVDELISRGFRDDVLAIAKSLKSVQQTMMFSATIGSEVQGIASELLDDYIVIESEDEGKLNIEVEHFKVDNKDKFKALLSLIYGRKPRSMIIFVNTKDECGRLKDDLEKKNIDCLKIHGGMLQEDRLKAMEAFKERQVPYLVATDVAARGIDVRDLDISLSYDFPVEKESYVHRMGRTGRNYREGSAIYFIAEHDGKNVRDVENFIGRSLGEIGEMNYGPLRTGKDGFREFQKELRKNRPQKTSVHKDITKIYINGGKKKKIRPLDIAGTLHSIPGIEPEDIGIIDVQENGSYIDILNGKGDIAIQGLSERTIKGKELRVEKARK
ncbi:DEAD/DEAH box helicase [Youngiibacter multivorans]|uniref:Superfamily II DNA/RNA helicase n=1 Tax=Youngiibacter multivorans TaxID=937251 RepID=A0ABS4FZI8_9CLOT|nr:DEAD/DEAH box helicase [Youngiibacter multivorans]MBP1917718.1 superfamily II DNA/RNA helicase [Youngiibacter multivorans]